LVLLANQALFQNEAPMDAAIASASTRGKPPQDARPGSSRRAGKISPDTKKRVPSKIAELAEIIDIAARTGVLEPAVTAVQLELSTQGQMDAAWVARVVRLLALVAAQIPAARRAAIICGPAQANTI